MSLPHVFNPDYVAPLLEGRRFPTAKFGQLYEVLVGDGVARLDQFHCAEPAPLEWIELAHDPAYFGGDYDSDHLRLARRHSLLHRAATEQFAAHRL